MSAEVRNQLPEAIKKEKAELKAAAAANKTEKLRLEKFRDGLNAVGDKDAQVKLVKNALHPDRAPEGRETKFKKAFAAFMELLT